MTKERLIELRKNCALDNPNMDMLKELYEYLLGGNVDKDENPLRTTQKVILSVVDDRLNKHW